MVGISRKILMDWQKRDLEFRELVSEIQWHKKNFFETALVDLVGERNPAAVIFANRTVNADRGYSEKLKVEHSGQIDTGFSIDDLDLSIETKREILDAIKRKEGAKNVLDAEVVKDVKQLPDMPDEDL